MPTKIDFIGGNTRRCLMTMALPMIAAMFLNMMYNLVDSLWIGNLLGETAYAALTNSTPDYFDFDLCGYGSDKRGVYFALTSHWGKGQKADGKFDRHLFLRGSRLFRSRDGHTGTFTSKYFKCLKYSG